MIELSRCDKGNDRVSDDMAWAKAYFDEGVAALDRGESVSLDEHKAHNAALLKSLGA